MSRIIYILLFLILIPFYGFSVEDDEFDSQIPNIPLEQSITYILNKRVKEDLAHVTYFVGRKDDIVTYGAIGLSNIEPKKKLEVEDIFPTASVSQNFSAAAALLLEERGKIKLTDTISKHFPKDSGYWGKSKMPDWADKITIHHLLSHSHGLPELYKYFIRRAKRFPSTISVFLPMLAEKKLDFEPGEKAVHSNTGYLLLEVILEKAAGKPLEVFYQEEFFDKLGMKNTFAVIPSRTKSAPNKRLSETKLPEKYNATTRIEEPEKIILRILNPNHTPPGPVQVDVGIYTNVKDLNIWQQALHNGKVITQESYEKMIKPYFANDSDGEEIVSHFGYGIKIARNAGKVKFYHQEADFEGIRAEIAYVPSVNVSVSMLSNIHLEEIAKRKYKSEESKIYDIVELRKVIFNTIRQYLQRQAVVEHASKSDKKL